MIFVLTDADHFIRPIKCKCEGWIIDRLSWEQKFI